MILVQDVSVQSINIALLDLDRRISELEGVPADNVLVGQATTSEINTSIFSLDQRINNIT